MAELDLARAVADTEGTPLLHARDVLIVLRKEGYDFDTAWTLMKRSMARGNTDDGGDGDAASSAEQITEWKALLEANKELWRSAFQRVIPPVALVIECFEAFDLAVG